MKTKLKEAILNTGLKQTFIANQCGICPTILSRYVVGKRKPSAARIKVLAKVLRCRQSDIY